MPLSKKVLIAAPVLVVAVYMLVFFIQYRIDDDADLAPNPDFVVEGGSRAVTMASTLMDLEINKTGWAPNKLWVWPVAHSLNMTAYQKGIQYAVARWVNEMSDIVGRDRGSGEADPDLVVAKGKFSYDPTAFILPSAVSQYKEGIAALTRYNRRLAQGQARYERLAGSLADVLSKIDKDLGSQSATLELTVLGPDDFSDEELALLNSGQRAALSSSGGYFDPRATEAYFATKGRMYTYYVLLEAMGEDFREVLATKGATEHWAKMLVSLRSGALLYKFFVANGSTNSYVIPSDLARQGFFLLRTDKQIQELIDILNR